MLYLNTLQPTSLIESDVELDVLFLRLIQVSGNSNARKIMKIFDLVQALNI